VTAGEFIASLSPRVRLYAGAGVALVVLFVLGWRVRPIDPNPTLARAEANGLAAARALKFHRELEAAAVESLTAARRRGDSLVARAPRRLAAAAEQLGRVTQPVHVDSTPHFVAGAETSADTLMPMPGVRLLLHHMQDSANAVAADLAAQRTLEQGRASQVEIDLRKELVDKDSVIAARDLAIGALKDSRPSIRQRAVGGLLDAGAALACGALGYGLAAATGGILAPIAGVVSAGGCAALAGILR